MNEWLNVNLSLEPNEWRNYRKFILLIDFLRNGSKTELISFTFQFRTVFYRCVSASLLHQTIFIIRHWDISFIESERKRGVRLEQSATHQHTSHTMTAICNVHWGTETKCIFSYLCRCANDILTTKYHLESSLNWIRNHSQFARVPFKSKGLEIIRHALCSKCASLPPPWIEYWNVNCQSHKFVTYSHMHRVIFSVINSLLERFKFNSWNRQCWEQRLLWLATQSVCHLQILRWEPPVYARARHECRLLPNSCNK